MLGESNLLVFFAKLYDASFGNAKGGSHQPPLSDRRWRNTVSGRGLKISQIGILYRYDSDTKRHIRTSSDGVVDVEHVVPVDPGQVAGHQVQILVYSEGTVLHEQTKHAGAAGPALQPESHRRCLRGLLRGGQSGSEWLRVAQSGSECLRAAQSVSEWLRVAQSGSEWTEWLRVAQSGSEWLRVAHSCSEWLIAS